MTTSVYRTLDELKIALPAATVSVAAFVPHVQAGKLLFISGHIAKRDGAVWVGQFGSDIDVPTGIQAARSVAIDLLGTLHATTGDLNSLARIVKLMVLVNSAPSFTEQHLVANGASELFLQVFGEAGKHVRSAFGVAQIPFGSCLEIDLIAELK